MLFFIVTKQELTLNESLNNNQYYENATTVTTTFKKLLLITTVLCSIKGCFLIKCQLQEHSRQQLSLLITIVQSSKCDKEVTNVFTHH